MRLDQFQNDYFNANFQLLVLDAEGIVQQSNSSFLPVKKGDLLTELHPFFEGLINLEISSKEEQQFYCIHLEFGNKELITDIRVTQIEEGIFVLIQDLTTHYNSYQEVAQARNESIINEELILIKNAELEERERFKNRFIQNFSHELRNPLMSSMAITQLLGDSELTSGQKQMVEVLRDSQLHLKLMLEDTLSLSMIASGKLEIKAAVFDLSKMLELLSFTYKTKALAKGLEFNFTKDERVPEWIESDRKRLFQVLTNLLDNAIKYTDEGAVSLEVGFNQQYAGKANLRFSIADTGRGIPEDKRELIFETFSQLTSPGNEQGTGLGLSLVKGLLSLMGSTISLESIPEKSSVFSFNLDVKIPMESSLKHSQEINTVATSQKIGRSGKKYRILLVEDDERVLTVLFKILMDTGKFYLDVLSDGALVLEQVIQNPYDLILMDINLPNTRGDQLTRIIREFPFKKVKQIPIVGITAFAYEDHLKAYKEAGMNTVLSKPFDKEDLLNTLYSFLRN
ncbi:MAG: response regulator [Muriicola sp.]|nr:response regulator [Muriicola sp.]